MALIDLPQPNIARCVICGSTVKVEGNHLGGRRHLAWFKMPFCYEHHATFHELVRQAGVDLRFTEDPLERIRRALAAIKIAEWMLLEQLKHEICAQRRLDDETSGTARAGD